MPISADQFALLAAWAEELRELSGEEPTLRSAVERTVDLLPDASWASITMRGARGRYSTIAQTDEAAARADALQYELGQGPCLEMAEDSGWYRSGDVACDHRWPAWGPRAAAQGVRSVLSISLSRQQKVAGSLNIYSRDIGAFADRAQIDVVLVFAAQVALAIGAVREISGLETAVEAKHRIGIAQGILMERHGLSDAQAFALIRRCSNETNVKARDVASEIIASVSDDLAPLRALPRRWRPARTSPPDPVVRGPGRPVAADSVACTRGTALT